MRIRVNLLVINMLILTACDAVDPEQRRKALHLPPPGFKGVAIEGEKLFQQYCGNCHGTQGEGSNQGPPLVNKIYRPAHHADLAFHIAVRDGVKQHHWQYGDMQSQPSITPEDTAHIIAFVRQKQQLSGIK